MTRLGMRHIRPAGVSGASAASTAQTFTLSPMRTQIHSAR